MPDAGHGRKKNHQRRAKSNSNKSSKSKDAMQQPCPFDGTAAIFPLCISTSFFVKMLFPFSSVARQVTFDDSKTTILSVLSKSFAMVCLFLFMISSSIISLDVRCS